MEERLRNIRNVDLDGLHDPEIEALKKVQPPDDMPFRIARTRIDASRQHVARIEKVGVGRQRGAGAREQVVGQPSATQHVGRLDAEVLEQQAPARLHGECVGTFHGVLARVSAEILPMFAYRLIGLGSGRR